MKSLLGYFSPYVRSLEERIERADFEKQKLLDRILHITTGAPLELPKEAIDGVGAQAAPVSLAKEAMEKAAEKELEFGGFPTFQQLLANRESVSFREDAGLDVETQLSAVVRSDEILTEEHEAREKTLKKQFKESFNKAKEEYLRAAPPVLTETEKRAQA